MTFSATLSSARSSSAGGFPLLHPTTLASVPNTRTRKTRSIPMIFALPMFPATLCRRARGDCTPRARQLRGESDRLRVRRRAAGHPARHSRPEVVGVRMIRVGAAGLFGIRGGGFLELLRFRSGPLSGPGADAPDLLVAADLGPVARALGSRAELDLALSAVLERDRERRQGLVKTNVRVGLARLGEVVGAERLVGAQQVDRLRVVVVLDRRGAAIFRGLELVLGSLALVERKLEATVLIFDRDVADVRL